MVSSFSELNSTTSHIVTVFQLHIDFHLSSELKKSIHYGKIKVLKVLTKPIKELFVDIVNTLSLDSNKQIKINFGRGDLSSDAGLLLIKEFVSRIGITIAAKMCKVIAIANQKEFQ